ncbi:unnamed protein product, partial [marine sediment metagenome]
MKIVVPVHRLPMTTGREKAIVGGVLRRVSHQ